jgi:hypothetical protein
MPTHPNAPTVVATDADFNVSSSTYDGNNGTDQIMVYGFVYLEAGFVRDNNGNTGELGGVWMAKCGDALTLQPGFNDVANTSGPERTLMDSTPVTEGWHLVVGLLSDLSAFGGWQLQHSTDEAAWVNIEGWRKNLPEIECFKIPCCQEATGDWSECKPKDWVHNAPVAPPAAEPLELEICEGPWAFASNPTGWLGITGGTRVPAAFTYVVEQFRTIATFVTPDCITDASISTDLGYALHYLRDARIYHLGEVRYLVNGTAVRTYTSRAYPYSDERTEADATEPQQYEWKHVGVDFWRLLNVPAGATVEVQVAHRVREAAPQDTPWSKAYVGLRSQAMMHTTPSSIVIGSV